MVRALALAAVVAALAPIAARADEIAPSSTPPLASASAPAPAAPAQAIAPVAPRELIGELTWKKAGLFAGGFVSAFALHESGHLVTGLSLGVHPRIAPVWFLGFIPFFAIDS
ncbi:MAG: hypothetical protein JST92_01940, partial [Deltaproteobacteria bacterium]|nr:hypothetical protein [Deltaproteobacteria bacterium]